MNLDGLLVMIIAIMFGPAILLTIIGFAVYKKKQKSS